MRSPNSRCCERPSPDVADRRKEFWEEALRLRDLMKFEFFFPEREVFQAQLAQELTIHHPAWEKRLDEGPDRIQALLPRLKPLQAHRILRPFLEAYRVVGDVLETHDPADALEAEPFLAECLALGQQYVLQRHLKRNESVSKTLFETAIKLARNRRLWDAGDATLSDRRAAFAEEIRQVTHRVDVVEAFVRARHEGLVT